MKVVVVGGGKMGLPLACQFADRSAHVTVCDCNERLVEQINRAEAPFDEPELPELLARNVQEGRLIATTATSSAVRGAEVVVVIVPALLTPDRRIDYTNLKSASNDIANGIQPETLVCYETTVPVRGCRDELIPCLEKSGLRAGEDFFVAFSPERVKSGHVFEKLRETPKVVGGLNKRSAHTAATFYEQYLGVDVIDVGSLEAAEFVKLAGMVYRDVNIALANELATYCEALHLDLPELISCINSNGEAHLATPGIGVGGHCTPVYPNFVIASADDRGVSLSLTQTARLTNEEQPARHVHRLIERFGDLGGTKIHILGLGFRPGVKEHEYSPAFPLADLLVRNGASVTIEDPLYSNDELRRHGFTPGNTYGVEVVILNTAHPDFVDPDFKEWYAQGVRTVLDGRNTWSRTLVESAGLELISVGSAANNRSKQRAIPITRPVLGSNEVVAVNRVIRSGWIAQGPRVLEFEDRMAQVCGVKHAVAVSSGTAALHLGLLAAGVGPGDEVICPSMSFIATANAIRYTGAEPAFVDVDPRTYNICPIAAEAAITTKTKAILVVHQIGLPADLDVFRDLSDRYGVKLLEDAACALGSRYKDHPIGGHAEMACFSFHPRKVLTTGEGGVITTNRGELVERLRWLRQHGMAVASDARHASSKLIRERFLEVGYNYRMTDMQAAIGIAQLNRLDWIVKCRRRLAKVYDDAFRKVPWVQTPFVPDDCFPNYQSYAIQLADDAPIQRDDLINHLLDRKISARPGISLSHLEPAYCQIGLELPNSARASARSLLLPLFPSLTHEDQQYVIDSITSLMHTLPSANSKNSACQARQESVGG